MYYVVDIDIKGFFDNVNHAKLIQQMWTLGIRDKQLLSIIKETLKAPIKLPNGNMVHPDKGTPQGGILSPLLSNIVLNELDWWVASQWEKHPVTCKYKPGITTKNGGANLGHAYRAMRNTNLKEVYIVRYADDFKLFCSNLEDAKRMYIATTQWLKDRLKLEISEEKSKIVNLKQDFSEFLGFKFRVHKKKDKFLLESHVSDKALERVKNELVSQIKYIQKPSTATDEAYAIALYNSKVIGIHNYYRFATHVTNDFSKISREINLILHNRLGKRLTRTGTLNDGYIKTHYGSSAQMRYVNGLPIVPVGYIRAKNPMDVRLAVCKYTPEGRLAIHNELRLDMNIMHALMRTHSGTRSIQFMDNRVSLYAAQWGRCAVLGEKLSLGEIHCHHKVPRANGGTDEYKNLVIVHDDVHKLIHATNQSTIQSLMTLLQLDAQQLKKLNKLRATAGLATI
jgi:group II intron reverse transcriptase/maturase